MNSSILVMSAHLFIQLIGVCSQNGFFEFSLSCNFLPVLPGACWQYKCYPSVFSQGALMWTGLELLKQVNCDWMIKIGIIENYVVVARISVLCWPHDTALQNLSSLTRDQTQAPSSVSAESYHWTTREVLTLSFPHHFQIQK